MGAGVSNDWCITRGVFADDVFGGLDRMATRALLPNVV